MLKQFFHRPHVRARFEANPLWSRLQPFVAYLHGRGYSFYTIHHYVQAFEHFGRWLGTQDSHDAVDAQLVRRFVRGHLPHCRCAPPAPTHRPTVCAALNHLLQLSRQSVSPQAGTKPAQPLDEAVNSFTQHLRDACGLAESTCRYRGRYTREFLQHAFGDSPLHWSRLRPGDVQSFVLACARRCRPCSVQIVASSLRSFLRWLQIHGHGNPALIAAVPHLPQYRLAHLPRVMNDEQLRQFLALFDRSTAVGRRDHALALCLVDLGLRVGEVARLLLDDIDWSRATLRIRGAKERRERMLPLLTGVGQAIADYLRQGRPQTASRHLFVRHEVPRGLPVSPELIRGVMRRAYAKIPGCASWTGTHVLRHTAATRMHRHGASLKEVADVLGHRCLDTTAIYAKVAQEQLVAVALPWPEVQA